MSTQNFSNHRQIVPIWHYIGFPIVLLTLIGSCVYLWVSWGGDFQHGASLQLATTVGLIITFALFRLFALKAQDRAIRVEENFRSYVRNGSLLDPQLTIRQIIGLRFASDEEYDALAVRAVSEGMSEADIKKVIKNWKADEYRV